MWENGSGIFANYTVTALDSGKWHLVQTESGPITITLPDPLAATAFMEVAFDIPVTNEHAVTFDVAGTGLVQVLGDALVPTVVVPAEKRRLLHLVAGPIASGRWIVWR